MTAGSLTTLSAIEDVVNTYAERFAKRYDIPKEKYRVNLTLDLNGIMGLKRGPVVQIFLLWPDAQAEMNSLLDHAFTLVSKKGLIDPVAIEPIIHIRQRREDQKKWIREKIGTEAEIISDLIPRSRLRVSRTTTVTVRDSITGASYSYTEKEPDENYHRNMSLEPWFKISRMVRDKEARDAAEIVVEHPTPAEKEA